MRLLGLAAALISSSCAVYKPPPAADPSNAVIANHFDSEFGRTENYCVTEVDKLQVAKGLGGSEPKEIPITPGPHVITLEGTYNSGSPDPYRYQGSESFSLQAIAGRRYRASGSSERGYIGPNGVSKKNSMVMWIEESDTGKIVTARKQVFLEVPLPSGPTPGIMFLPVR